MPDVCVWGGRGQNTYTLLVGMQIIVVTMELIVEVPPKTENRIIL
jgi:hypothetical protein